MSGATLQVILADGTASERSDGLQSNRWRTIGSAIWTAPRRESVWACRATCVRVPDSAPCAAIRTTSAKARCRARRCGASSATGLTANGPPSGRLPDPPSRPCGSAGRAGSSDYPTPPRGTRAEPGSAGRVGTTRRPWQSFARQRRPTISCVPHPMQKVEPWRRETACWSALHERAGILGFTTTPHWGQYGTGELERRWFMFWQAIGTRLVVVMRGPVLPGAARAAPSRPRRAPRRGSRS